MNNTFETHKEYWIDEYHHGTRYGIKGEILVQTKSKFQEILIIKSKFLGNALLLNNCWMISEKHDNHYHECLIHPALSSAKTIEKILIIGGGDGGSAKECLKYSAVKEIDLVEIDELVMELSKKYLQKINKDIWDNKKLNIHIKDGIEWVKSTEDNSYDVVIIDCSDPKGTSKGLFSLAFLKDCKRILKYGGVFATQSESPESFTNEHLKIIKNIRETFDFADPMYSYVPMYPSGLWSWTFASDNKPYFQKPLLSRSKRIEEETLIWSSSYQKGGFNLMPSFIQKALNQS
tara:strand:- start:22653 stop:23522 length:870 start_codon:yes stop_codon:yes gene_type:complete